MCALKRHLTGSRLSRGVAAGGGPPRLGLVDIRVLEARILEVLDLMLKHVNFLTLVVAARLGRWQRDDSTGSYTKNRPDKRVPAPMMHDAICLWPMPR